MSDIQKSILLKIDIDNADGERRLAEIRDEINKLQESQKNNTRATQEQKDAYEKSAIAVKSLQQEQRNLQGIMVAQTNAAKANKGSFQELYNQWRAAEAQLKNLSGTIQKNEDGTMSLTQEYKDQAAEVDKLKQTLLLFNAGIAQGNLNVGNYGNTLDGMRQKLKDLGVIIQTTDVGTEEFKAAREEAEKLKTQIQIASGEIDDLGNKTAKNKIADNFNNITGATQALTGALGLATLATGDNEEAQEKLRKVMGGLALAQTALTIARQKNDILGAAELIKTKALTAAKSVYTAVVSGATVAQKAFNATLVGVALTGFIILISKLAEAWRDYRDSARGATSAQEALNAARDEFAAKEKTDFEKRLEKFDKVLRGYEREIELLELSGATDEEVTAKRIKLLEDTLSLYKKMQSEVKVSGDAWNILADRINDTGFELKRLRLEASNANKAVEDAADPVEEVASRAEEITRSIGDWGDIQERNKRILSELLPLYKAMFGDEGAAAIEAVVNGTAQLEQGLVGVEAAQAAVNASAKKYGENIDANLEKMMQQFSLAQEVALQMGNAIGETLGQSSENVREFQKELLKISLTALKNALMTALAEGLFKELATKGIAGLVTGAIVTTAITAAYQTAINNIEGFATGGRIKGGTPIQRSNGDDVLITAKRGEVILNDGQQRRLERMGGRDIWNRLGVPGFADGGFVPRQIAGEAAMNVSMSAMRDLQDVIRSMPAPVLTYREFATFERSVQMADGVSGL